MNSQWVGIAISVFAVLSGMAVNLFIIGRVSGQWSETLKNIVAALAKVETQVEDLDERADRTENKRALMDARLTNVETATDKFWAMRDEFVAMRTTVEISGKHQGEELKSLARSVAVIERQIGNLVSSKTGFTVISTEDKHQ